MLAFLEISEVISIQLYLRQSVLSTNLNSPIRKLLVLIKQENHVFIEEETPQLNKVVTIEEELDRIDIDGIRNLLDSPGLMFIREECGNLKVVVDGGELTRNNDGKRMSEVLQAYI